MYSIKVFTAEGFQFEMKIPEVVVISEIQVSVPEGVLGTLLLEIERGEKCVSVVSSES